MNMRIEIGLRWFTRDVLLGIITCPAEYTTEDGEVRTGRVVDIGLLFVHLQITITEGSEDGEV